MELLYKNRDIETQDFIKEVCGYILSQPLEYQENSDDFCAVFVEGRNREINTLEDLTSIYSFKKFSKYNYPVYCFVNNINNFYNDNPKKSFEYKVDLNKLLNQCRINVIKIPSLNSLEEYSKFCIEKLYFMLPSWAERVITLQPDAMLLKPGWEDFILENDFDWISPHWKHYARIQLGGRLDDSKRWDDFNSNSVCIGGGGFSFRKASKMRLISNSFNGLKLREYGRNDDRPPMEDLFFTFFGFNWKELKLPTLKQCDQFAIDPLTKERWNNKETLPFGFHYFKPVSEFPPCNHE